MVSVDDEYEYELRARVRLLSLVLSGPDMGTIHVNLLDGHDITAADRNGKSDVSLCVMLLLLFVRCSCEFPDS